MTKKKAIKRPQTAGIQVVRAGGADCLVFAVPVVHFIPLGCISSTGGGKVLGGMESSSEQIPVSSRLADDRQLARWPSQRVAERCRLSKTSCDKWQVPPAFQLTILIKVTNTGIDRQFIFFFFSKGRKYGVASFAATAFSLIASAGFFPINLVISPFREQTSGSLLTQAVDCCPSRSRISTPYGNRTGVQQGCG